MFRGYIEGDMFEQRALDDDVFSDQYTGGLIDGYVRDKYSDVDAMSAWEYWDEHELFADWLKDHFDKHGYTDYDDKPQDGAFVWMRDHEQLVVKPCESELPSDVVAMFDRDSIYEASYAEGIVRNGVFYCTDLAHELEY